MARRLRFRLTWFLPLAVAGPASVAEPVASAAGADFPGRCGIAAAMDYRKPEKLRDKPPACALPTAREVALSCAVHDLVTSPGYRPPDRDEEGVAIGGSAVPEYRVSNLRCRFTGRHRNRALCRFRLSLPGGTAIGAAVPFEHLYWRDDGPAHHLAGTRWSAAGRCTPAKRNGATSMPGSEGAAALR